MSTRIGLLQKNPLQSLKPQSFYLVSCLDFDLISFLKPIKMYIYIKSTWLDIIIESPNNETRMVLSFSTLSSISRHPNELYFTFARNSFKFHEQPVWIFSKLGFPLQPIFLSGILSRTL